MGARLLCTFRTRPYITNRELKRRQAPDCFRGGVIITLNIQTTKRRHHHIEESFSLNNAAPPVDREMPELEKASIPVGPIYGDSRSTSAASLE